MCDTKQMSGRTKERTSSRAAAAPVVDEPPSAASVGVISVLPPVGFVAFKRKTLLPSFVFLAFFRPLFLSIATLMWVRLGCVHEERSVRAATHSTGAGQRAASGEQRLQRLMRGATCLQPKK